MNNFTSSSSIASFQNVIFLYRSVTPAPSSIRFSVLLPASGWSICSRPARMKHRIVPQLLVIVDVFVAQRQTVDPLRQHLLNRVLDPLLVAGRRENTPPVAAADSDVCPVWRNSKAPPSELIVPPSKRATISRRPHASNPKLDWLHSVIAKAVPFLALTAVWKLSYAMKNGLLLYRP